MKIILVLAKRGDFFEAVKSVSAGGMRIIECRSLDEAGPPLEHGIPDVCVVDLDSFSAQPDELTFLEKLSTVAGRCGIVVYTAARPPGWEAEAYDRGAAYALTKPVHRRVLAPILARLSARPQVGRPSESGWPHASGKPQAPSPSQAEKGQILKSVCGLFSHSLDAQAMLQDFLLLLREVFSMDRAAIFLSSAGGTGTQAVGAGPDRLVFAHGIGVPTSLMKVIELSSQDGIGGHLFRFGRILRLSSEEIRHDDVTQKEFQWLGVQVAAAITDGESVLGIAALGGRITGEPLGNTELEIIFHLLQRLGLGIRNSCLHQEVAANRQLLTDVVSELNSACVVISRDLMVLHSNARACQLFLGNERPEGKLQFTDIPTSLGAKVHQVLMTGAALTGFSYKPIDSSGAAFQIDIIPLQKPAGDWPGCALLIAEDTTQRERLRDLEIEAANLRLVNAMGYRLTNEIRNATVSLVAHQQLLKDRWNDAGFRSSLDTALASTARRVGRLSDQMCFLALERSSSKQTFSITELVEESFKEACLHQPTANVQFKCEAPGGPLPITGDRAALKHAFVELLINALQANPQAPQIEVRVQTASNGSHRSEVKIDVLDNGPGFPAEAARKATEPFFTTRIVGAGLGLTVCRRIIEAHHGHLELGPGLSGQVGLVRVTLPFGNPLST